MTNSVFKDFLKPKTVIGLKANDLFAFFKKCHFVFLCSHKISVSNNGFQKLWTIQDMISNLFYEKKIMDISGLEKSF